MKNFFGIMTVPLGIYLGLNFVAFWLGTFLGLDGIPNYPNCENNTRMKYVFIGFTTGCKTMAWFNEPLYKER